jgi:hypothetical protein
MNKNRRIMKNERYREINQRDKEVTNKRGKCLDPENKFHKKFLRDSFTELVNSSQWVSLHLPSITQSLLFSWTYTETCRLIFREISARSSPNGAPLLKTHGHVHFVFKSDPWQKANSHRIRKIVML